MEKYSYRLTGMEISRIGLDTRRPGGIYCEDAVGVAVGPYYHQDLFVSFKTTQGVFLGKKRSA